MHSLARYILFSAVALLPIAAQPAFQGFETDTGDWSPITTRVPSGGGVLHLTAAGGNYYAELTNVYDTYLAGYGGAEDSFFGYATPPPYIGDFSQSIKMYIFANWPVAIYNGPGVWIDESPANFASGNYGSEHNFRLTPTGTAVEVFVDGQPTPIATITTSGWYNFQMTFQKGANPTDLVVTNMNVFDPGNNLIGTTQVLGNSPSGPLLSQDLMGPGYVWITVWPDGWPAAGVDDVLAIDDVRADLLSYTPPDAFQVGYAANLTAGDSTIDITNDGATDPAATPGTLCVNVYGFDASEELLSCCTCTVTPNGLVSLSVLNSMRANTMTGEKPLSMVIKLVATTNTGSACDAATVTTAQLGVGMRAWATTLHALAGGKYGIAEIPFADGELSPAELNHLTSFCGFIQGNGTGAGVCAGCSAGGLSAATKLY